jgi:hypothetical protein
MSHLVWTSCQSSILRIHASRWRRRRRLSPRLEALEDRVALSTLTVTSRADSGTGSLRAEIAAAKSGDTIIFSSALDGDTIHLTSGELPIGESLSIKGPGASLLDVDAGGLSRVFDITSASVAATISGLTISGGKAEDGGGILDQGGTLTLKADVISNDQAIGANPGDTAQGGGVDITDDGSLDARTSTFQSDLAQGAVGAQGGTAYYAGQGGAGSGGAIFADVGTAVTISGTAFIGNQAVGGAGGSGATGVLDDFGGDANGGALNALGNSLTVSDSSFTDDLAQGGMGGQGQGFSDNFGGNVNGTINLDTQNASATFTFNGDTFTGEEAIGGDGTLGGTVGGVINVNDIQPALSLVNCTATDNLTQGGAGGIGGNVFGAVISTSGNLLVSGSTFIGNQAIGGIGSNATTAGEQGGYGGIATGCVISSFGNQTTVSGSTFIGNQASGGAGGNGDGGNGGAGGPVAGGAFYVFAGITVTDSAFIANQATGGVGGNGGNGGSGGAGGIAEGAAIFSQGDPTTFPGNPPLSTISSCTFIGDETRGGAGGSGGQGAAGGAGGLAQGGDLAMFGFVTITSSSFTGSLASGGAGGNGGRDGNGGDGGSAQGGSLDLVNLLSSRNNIIDVTDSVTNTTVLGATASGGNGGSGAAGGNGGLAQGGGIAADVQSSTGTLTVTISGSVVAGNDALGGNGGNGGTGGNGGNAEGGGIFVDASSIIALSGCLITGNQADGGLGGVGGDSGDRGTGVGGGVYLTGVGSTKKNTIIAGNSASTSNNDVYGTFS